MLQVCFLESPIFSSNTESSGMSSTLPMRSSCQAFQQGLRPAGLAQEGCRSTQSSSCTLAAAASSHSSSISSFCNLWSGPQCTAGWKGGKPAQKTSQQREHPVSNKANCAGVQAAFFLLETSHRVDNARKEHFPLMAPLFLFYCI